MRFEKLGEAEGCQRKRRDVEISEAEKRVEEWVGEEKCGELMDEGFQCRGKAVRQSVGFEGNDEEWEQKHNLDGRWVAGKGGGWAANRDTKAEGGHVGKIFHEKKRRFLIRKEPKHKHKYE